MSIDPASVGIGIVIGILCYVLARGLMNLLFPPFPSAEWLKNECPHGYHPEVCGTCNPVES